LLRKGSQPFETNVAALTFAAKHSRDKGLDLFKSNNFEGEPRTWKLENLVASAAIGGDRGILSAQTKARAQTLILTRQRIHAGRMLSLYPGGPLTCVLRKRETQRRRLKSWCVVCWTGCG
jgi:hypothetical protein